MYAVRSEVWVLVKRHKAEKPTFVSSPLKQISCAVFSWYNALNWCTSQVHIGVRQNFTGKSCIMPHTAGEWLLGSVDLLCWLQKVWCRSHSCFHSVLRLHAGHGALPAGAHPSPHPVSVWQKGPGPLHCLLDLESLCTLGGFPAPRLVSQTAHDGAPETHPGQQQEGAGSRLQVSRAAIFVPF